MLRWLVCPLVLIWCLQSAAPPAHARRGGRASATDRRNRTKARKHFKKGRRLFHRRRYKQAVLEFEQAYQFWKHHSILFNLALAHALLGQKVQAGAYLRKYHKAPGKKRRRMPRILRVLKTQVATLIIKVADAAAVIFVDGQRVGYGAVEVVVLAGKHVVEVRKGDWVARRQQLTVAGGAEKSWELAEMPRQRARPRPGPDPVPKPKGKPLRRLHWAYFTGAAAVTVGLLAGAVAMSVQNKKTYEKFEQQPWDATVAAKGRKQQVTANVLWGLTATAAAATAVLGVFTRWKLSSETSNKVSVAPGFWPGGASVKVQW